MKVLLIAPEYQDLLDTVPEIRRMSRDHQVVILNGKVRAADVYDICTPTSGFNVVHFASHGGDSGIALSDGDVLSPRDIGKIGRVIGDSLVLMFFNACMTMGPATYATRHEAATYAIHAIQDIPDDESWQMPSAFYAALHQIELEDMVDETPGTKILRAYLIADDGNASYSWTISPKYALDLLRLVRHLQKELRELKASIPSVESIVMLRSQFYRLIFFVVVAVIFLFVLIAYITGGIVN